MRKACVVLALLALTPGVRADTPPAPREGATFAPPLYGAVVAVYDAPDDPFAAGHRGIDVSAPLGSPVRAAAAGTVSFAGTVAGNTTVTIDHDAAVKTSYSFLASLSVKKGQVVRRGTVVGTLGRGHPSSGLPPHVHFSARRNGAYFDPMEILVGSRYDDLIELVG